MSGTTILIVEDERVVAADLARKLTRLNYEVVGKATSGAESLELARQLRPSLVLMDILLQGTMDGIEAALAIRREQEVPVVYLTAYSDPATLARAKLTGPFGYVLKPFDERDLATQIEIALYRHHAERELRQQREWLRVTLASIDDAVIATNAQGQIAFVNPAAAALTGWEADAAIGQPVPGVFRLVDEQTGAALEPPVACVLRDGQTVATSDDATLVGRDGRRFLVEYRAAAIRNGDGSVRGAVLVSRDVTERRRAEQALRNIEQATLQAIPDLLFEVDREGRIFRYNAPSDEHLYVSPAEFLGRTFHDVLPCEAADVIREALAKADLAGVHRGATYALPFPEGTRWYELSIAVRHGTAGGDRRFIVLVRDITARKRAQMALAEAKEAADRANQAKSQFLAHVSHELRTPMAAVLGMLERSLREQLGSGLREHLQLAKSAAELQLELLDELLDFSRIEAGKIALEMVEFNLRTTLEQTLRVLAVKAHEKGLELQFHLPRLAPIHLVGDAFRLRQILQNLLGNAIKFTDKGEVTLRVTVDTQTPQEVGFRFAVSDTGIGISREDQARIFAPFTQGDASLTRRHGGTGLGLGIASSLVALMDGRMSVDSAAGRGSTFTFTARFQRQAEELETPPLEQAFLPQLRELSVLVADAHPAGRQLVCEILADWSLQPTAAGGTREALDAAQLRARAGRPFQALILDAGLLAAEQDAWQEFLRRPGRHGPAVVVLTPSGGLDAAKRWRRFRKDLTVVEKPLSQADLLLALLRGLKIVPRASLGEVREQRLTPAARSLRILVADDASIGRLFVSETLQERGHAVCTAASGREAFELVRDQSFDVVLMDVQMPEMDGYQATAAIRALPDSAKSKLPIVALTAHARLEDEQECLAAGMNAYLAKPLATADLIELVERLAP